MVFWLFVTAFNLTKAYHIDDTAHLETARAIQNDPLHPMSQTVNWIDTAEPIHKLNQPHLFFYLIALVVFLFGESEVILHLLLAIFSLLANRLFLLNRASTIKIKRTLPNSALLYGAGFHSISEFDGGCAPPRHLVGILLVASHIRSAFR